MTYQEYRDVLVGCETTVVLNGLTTPDGTMLISRHRHDYVTHTDKNGKWYMIDGGRDYTRCSMNGDEFHWSVTSKDDYETIRQFIGRGGHGKDGKDTYRFTTLAKMSDEYLSAAIDYVEERNQSPFLLLMEKEFRKHYEIEIHE